MGDEGQRTILTKREKEVFQLLSAELSTKKIAQQLGISEKTVRNHISNTIQKLGVSSRTQALTELIRLHQLSIY